MAYLKLSITTDTLGCGNRALGSLKSVLFIVLLSCSLSSQPLRAQTSNPIPPIRPLVPSQPTPPLLPPPEDLFQLPTPTQVPVQAPLNIPGTITVERFEVVGSTAFSPEVLANVTAKFTRRSLTFVELLQAAAAITQLYVDQGYTTSGALIPANQKFQAKGGVVKIQVLEGSLEEIQVRGTQRLDPGYVRSRLAVATAAPLNIKRLLAALQLLKLDPLLRNISAELATGTSPGKNLLMITVSEADTFQSQFSLDNSRSPSVGSEKRQVQFTEANLLGLGDTLSLAYANTDGSNAINASYTLPINPYNGTLQFGFSTTSSTVIESPFNILDINATSRSYDLTLRQPILQTPAQEIALGMTLDRRESETSLLGIPFPLSAGADDQGNTRITALRFFQELTQRDSQTVIALRSQLSIGLDVLGATLNATAPDTRFFAWRGQAQYVRLLAPDTLLLVRGDLQLADRALVPLEQIGLGGQQNIRGYRQDTLLTDNGAFASTELRVPVLRIPEIGGILHLTPFIDFASGWNSSNRSNPNPNTLVSGGLGLLWRQSDYFTAQFSWGIPFISVSGNKNTWQENGLYFSLSYSPF
ncbi:MAG: ShlB/FhaC/HecB family hemolysin secretion/activation protein [Leptolyngbyaceae bacterium]|nr:ShlB/FhaC/HecB family hemolysin secretion/activation protein [Leptolyngbyaceae bacterium]